MGRLIKNHWARLIILSAAVCKLTLLRHPRNLTNICNPDQVAAAIEAFIWPKIFWDFLTRSLDGAVRPIPVLQILNLLFGLVMISLEWPLGFVAGSALHRSLEFRLALLPLTALCAALIYQGTNAAIYYLIGMVVYFWAYSEGEIICAKPWTLPQRGRGGASRV
ncbi:hypothetical protein FALCPG4_000650 [Fusarium falciforme]